MKPCTQTSQEGSFSLKGAWWCPQIPTSWQPCLVRSSPLKVEGPLMCFQQIESLRRDGILFPRLSLKRLWLLSQALVLILSLTGSERSHCPVITCPVEGPRWQGTDATGQRSAGPRSWPVVMWVGRKADSPWASLQMRLQPSQQLGYSPRRGPGPKRPA